MDYIIKKVEVTESNLKKYSHLLSLVFSNTNKFTLKFLEWQYKDNPQGLVEGFDAFYTSTTSSAGCSGATTFTANTGSFSDGSMGNNYNNNQFCSWLIQPTAGTITLSFSAFATEASLDRVLVFDGIDNTAPQIGNFSGSAIPANLTSSSNSLYLEFRLLFYQSFRIHVEFRCSMS